MNSAFQDPARITPPAEVCGIAHQPTGDDEFIRVVDAQQRYLGGTMSRRWWYRQIELGRLPHLRAGGAVLLRPADIQVFIQECFREKTEPTTTSENSQSVPDPTPTPKRRASSLPDRPLPGGLRFFKR